MDRHRFHADPDPNFHFDADPDPDTDWHQNGADPYAYPSPSLAHAGNFNNFFTFQSQHCQFTMVYLSHQCKDVIIFSILDSMEFISGKKYSLST